jgi:hypothetical protein
MLISAYPALMFVLIRETGKPVSSPQEGILYDWVYYVFLILLLVVLVWLFGMILSWIAYLRNKPYYILTSLYLLGINGLACLRYPPYLMGPVPLLILGFFAYREVKKLKVSSKNPLDLHLD